jgi:hypothetical protein
MVTEKQIWAKNVGNPQFTNTGEMFARINTLKASELITPLSPEMDPISEVRIIREVGTGRFQGHVSSQYNLLQDFQIAIPLFDELEDAGLEPVGFIDQLSNGLMKGAVFFPTDGDLNREVRAGETIAYGLTFYNGKNGWAGFGAKGTAMRVRCTNGLVSTMFLGSFKARHLKSKEAGVLKFAHAIKDLISGIPKYEKAVQTAAETEIEVIDLRPLLMGAGLANEAAEDIVADINRLVPDMTGPKMTGWRAHNGLTAYASHEEHSASHFDRLSEAANKLLVVDLYPKLIEEGRILIEAIEAKKK